ncbi:MAG: SxtJ family membrane protein [Bacteroidetes bacterium]|jgi:uncharacterized membrane protein|nr:SxtJ family membrane protein [Bacteroidota bacterium]MDF1863535.1 SxtJ family membrane protein [Saprospiraceae bacterium]
MEREKNIETLLVITAGLLVLYYIFDSKYFILAAAIVSIGGLMFPFLAKGIHWFWYKLAMALGYVNSRILLSLIFFIFLMPVAWLAKLFSKDSLQLKKKTAKNDSYYVDRNYAYEKKDLENMW